MMAAALAEILSRVPPQREGVPAGARAALRDRYGLGCSAATLIRVLRTYYAMLLTEAGAHIAPRCDVLPSSGAEEYTALWPEGSAARNDLRRHCGLFADMAFSSDGPRDLFRGLYEAIFPPALRHAGGEYYTPDCVAELALDRADFPREKSSRLLDPSCGSGVFLIRAARRLEAVGGGALNTIFGFDINPLAVLAARVNLLACLGQRARNRRKVPNVFRHDCILADNRWGAFELVVGNPPWVLWDNLPPAYRKNTTDLWKRYGLFNLPHTQARLGGGKKDLAMLATYAAADKYLASGGRLVFVISQGILQSAGAGAGFRRFQIGELGEELGVKSFDDLTALDLFDAAARPGVIVLEKGQATRYPVPYTVWSRDEDARNALSPARKFARPVAGGRSDAPWQIIDSPAAGRARSSSYTARTGAYTGGANGVYWVEVLRDGKKLARIRNMPRAGKRRAEEKTAGIETQLIYPLLRWRDVARWRAIPRQHILMVQDAASRKPLPEPVLRESFPRTYSYLKSFETLLHARKSKMIRDLMDRNAFYAMFGIGKYTLSPWKVVWRRMVREFTAAVVGRVPVGGRAKPVIPQETLAFIPCASQGEAHYLCALLNSPQATAKARSFAVPGGKSFGTPGMLKYFGIRQYNAEDPVHVELSGLSRRAHAAAVAGSSASEVERRIAELVSAGGVLT